MSNNRKAYNKNFKNQLNKSNSAKINLVLSLKFNEYKRL